MWSHVVVSLLLAAAGAAPAGAGAGAGAGVEPYNSTAVSRCTASSLAGLPLRVLVAGCAAPPCRLPQLQHAEIDIAFRAPRDLESMETLASVALLGQPIPFPLGAAGATCAGLQGAACPVRRGELLRYRLRIYVEQYLPVVGHRRPPGGEGA
ncbi:NPC intracellular cholesterol transporter 2 isoform X2 [Plutella xylostella]|uniref:NPC intracellular cholesterol transporter 2 isoform X2 n=1 Tax=Plutella xylostella TaxID=51655 RepID=UPI00203219B0|nr:NPC intracellular cholesterol transporter 2 isoform X2 [Plutella xylostella]